MKANKLIEDITAILQQKEEVNSRLQKLCARLLEDDPRFTWVGFYFMNHDTQKLHLGPYTGPATDHVIIPFGKGICGQVAVSGSTYVSDDVQAEQNYIACSLDVRSEIVIPIYDNDQPVAQLDIDSNTPESFKKEEQEILDEICRIVEENCAAEMHYKKLFSSL